jgi:hypothetical protein
LIAVGIFERQSKIMLDWQWESFKEIIEGYAPTVDDHGPLAGPIHRFSIRRGEGLAFAHGN